MKHPHSINSRLLIGSFLFIFILALAACSKNDDNPRPAAAGFMAFNLSPDNPLIGIALSGNTLDVPLPYTNYTGGYIGIYPGQRSTESFDVSSGNTLTTTAYTYAANHYYSLFVTGINDTYQNIIVEDKLDSLSATPGKAYIRYVNAVPDSGSSQVTINDGQSDVVNDHPDFNTVSAFTSIKNGAVTIAIDNGSKIKATRTINLEERKIYTVLFLGDPQGNDPGDSIQIRYIENGTLKMDTAQAKAKNID